MKFCDCGCGHHEKKQLVKTIGVKTFCQECWRNYQEKAGLVDAGCIFPNAKVCMDREPAILPNNAILLEEIKKAKCYRGHNYCIKYEADNILSIIRRTKRGQPVTCPNEGCGRLLVEITTGYCISLICPVHGVVLKAVTERDE